MLRGFWEKNQKESPNEGLNKFKAIPGGILEGTIGKALGGTSRKIAREFSGGISEYFSSSKKALDEWIHEETFEQI